MKRGWRMQNKRLVSATLISLLVFILTTHFASGGFGGPSKPPAQSNISEPIKVIAPQPAQQVVTSQPAQQDLPVIETFTVQPSTIKPGECTYIYWTVKKADSVASNFGSINSPTSPGSREFSNAMQTCPTQTTTYTITATTKQGTNKTATTTIQVTTPQPKQQAGFRLCIFDWCLGGTNKTTTQQVVTSQPAQQDLPVIETFTVQPSTIKPGECTYIYWTVKKADSVASNFGSINSPTSPGSREFSNAMQTCPTQTTTYTITATTKQGTNKTATTTIQVTTPQPKQQAGFRLCIFDWCLGGTNKTTTQQVVTSQPAQQDLPVIETFTVQPSTIKPGECTYIYWTVKKADSVASNFGSINSPTSPGSREFSNAMQTCPTQTTTYTITATTKQGTNKTATTTIQVTTPQPKQQAGFRLCIFD